MNSASEVLWQLPEQQPAFCTALLSPQVRRSSTGIFTLNEMDIGKAEETVRALKSTAMSEEKHPTLALAVLLLIQLLHDTQDNTGNTVLIRDEI